MAKRVRRAITSVVFTGAPTKEQIGQLVGAPIVGPAGGFYAVWRTSANAPAS